jgi:hypothetical protein
MKEYNVQGTKREKKHYKASRPKAKREITLYITVSPLIKKSLSCWLSLVAHKTKFILELPLPSTEVDLSIVFWSSK